jgi:thiamine biosynthesis lipoprotein
MTLHRALAAVSLAVAACLGACRDSSTTAPRSGPTLTPTPALRTPSAAIPERVAIEGHAMGTAIHLTAYTTAALNADATKRALGAALGEIRRLETLMTTWRKDSELSRVNASAGKAASPVSRETLDVIQKSLWIGKASEGTFDITFEAMHGLWKFDEDLEAKVPPRELVQQARVLIDYRDIVIDEPKGTVMLRRPGMRMSLGGIAKGYAVDAASHVLAKAGLAAFMVQAGGDLYVRGRKPDGAAWRVGVRDPRGPSAGDYFAMMEIEDHAFSTAGDYERSFVLDGRRYHHIIDPRTGFPATASRSVTVWAKDAFTADALDDAVFILGVEKGLALIESVEGAGALIVDTDNQVHISKRLESHVEVLRPPTEGI